ncbi:MAG: Rieske (2Fe-2S) protein [Candidatus Bipolaricaulia bacterium]
MDSESEKTALEDRGRGKVRISRRRLVQWLMGLGAGSLIASVLSILRFLKPSEGAGEVGALISSGDRLVFAQGANRGTVITRESLAPGEAVLVFPQGKEQIGDAIILLARFDPEVLEPPTRLEWTAVGFVGYSALCTHLGCTVLKKLEAGFGKEGIIHCPCHAGFYDPKRGATVISGPPPRPLPQLPIRINGKGEIVADGDFEESVGVL